MPAAAARTDQRWAELVSRVLGVNDDPQNELDVVAILESLGWTDHRADEVMGFPDLFELGQELYPQIRSQVRTEVLVLREEEPWHRSALQFLWHFLRGIVFMLPILVSVLAMIVLRISYASFQYFTVAQATALALASFLSSVVTGGFIQSMAHSVYLFLGYQEPNMARLVSNLWIRWGLWACLALVSVLFLLDIPIRFMPLSLVAFMALYTVFLSAMWLGFAQLYVLHREYLLGLIALISALAAYAIWRSGLPVVLAHVVSISLGTVIALGVATWEFMRRGRDAKNRVRVVRPRASQLAYTASPYFLYGVMYFLYLYLDRLISWSTLSSTMPYYIWFRGQYELGMDWSILMLVLPVGVAEVLLYRLMEGIQQQSQKSSAASAHDMSNAFRRQYGRSLVPLGLIGVVGAIGGQFLVRWASGVHFLAAATPFAGIERYVFTLSSIGYVLLGTALYNILLMFSLGVPRPVLRTLTWALITDFAVGLVLTRVTGQYQLAVWGLVAGSAFLLVATTRELFRLLPSIDFFMYRMV